MEEGKNNPTQFVRIIGKEVEETYTVYIIQVTLEKYSWTVRRRYSHFVDLDKQLTRYWKLDKTLLPPKKIFGNQSDTFVQKRKNELEIYLQTVLRLLPKVPPPLASFLDFSTYEIHGILQTLSTQLFYSGDLLLASEEPFLLSPLDLYALCERLKLPEPPCESSDKSQDLSHVLEYITRVEKATVMGSVTPILTSNIVPNQLRFDLLRFRNLKHLKLEGCCPFVIAGLETIRQTLISLEIHSTLSTIKDFLLCDVIHPDVGTDRCPSLQWAKLSKADFSYNSLTAIDGSVRLLSRVEELNLSHNHIEQMRFLESLPQLRSVDLSSNNFRQLEDLHTRLGNVVVLNLSDNRIESLVGFTKLYSLVSLDLTSNRVSQITEVAHLAGLPCIENIALVANPVTIAIDYRTRVLELFESRASEISLDNESATAKELSTVAVRLALRRGRQGLCNTNPDLMAQSSSNAESSIRGERVEVANQVSC